MDERFLLFQAHLDDVLSHSERPGAQTATDALIDLWAKLRAQGVEAYDFAHSALLMAETVMSYFDSLEENLAFGEFLKEAGSSKIRAVTAHWPPVDPQDWPADWPKDQFE